MTVDKSAEEVRKLYADEQSSRLGDLRDILKTPQGKRYVWWMMGRAHMFTSTFTGNSTGAFLEGERNIGLMLFNDIMGIDPKLMGQMAQSHAARMEMLKEKKEKTNG